MLRFNADSSGFEGFNGTVWAGLGAANASSVAFTPVGSVSATNVQTAIAELDNEKVAGSVSGTVVSVNDSVGTGALEIDQAAKTIKGINGYSLAGNGPAFAAATVGGQAFTTGVASKFNNTSETFDLDNSYDAPNSRFQPQVKGLYQVNLSVSVQAATTLASLGAQVRKNGLTPPELSSFFTLPTAAINGTVPVSGLIYLNGTTDYIESWVTATGTGALTATARQNAFSAVLVRAT